MLEILSWEVNEVNQFIKLVHKSKQTSQNKQRTYLQFPEAKWTFSLYVKYEGQFTTYE